MTKIAILGAGFIGKNLVNSYVDSGYRVSVLNRSARPENIPDTVDWVEGLLENQQDVRMAIRNSGVVFHLISSTVPGDAVDENEEIVNNVVQTINLLKLCVQEDVKRVIFISSASVYGIKENLPIIETASTDPISSHGIHKLTIEKYLQLYQFHHGLDCKIVRLSNPYGQGQDINGRQGVVAICIGKIIADESITVIGDGSSIRDFIHIDDAVRACRLIAHTESKETVFNIGSGEGVSINAVLQQLQLFHPIPLKISHAENRKNDIKASILDIGKAKRLLDFEPQITFEVGLKKTIQAYLQEHPEWKDHFNI